MSERPHQVVTGALYGAGLAALFVFFGIVRVLLAGTHFGVPTAAELRPIAFYIGGFTLAGAFVGLVRPLLSTHKAIYVALALAGVVVMLMIVASDVGLASMNRTDWIVLPVLGAFVGLCAAYGFLRASS